MINAPPTPPTTPPIIAPVLDELDDDAGAIFEIQQK